MGEIAEMILNGDCCELCGDFIGEGDGYPMYCDYCHQESQKLEDEKTFGQK